MELDQAPLSQEEPPAVSMEEEEVDDIDPPKVFSRKRRKSLPLAAASVPLQRQPTSLTSPFTQEFPDLESIKNALDALPDSEIPKILNALGLDPASLVLEFDDDEDTTDTDESDDEGSETESESSSIDESDSMDSASEDGDTISELQSHKRQLAQALVKHRHWDYVTAFEYVFDATGSKSKLSNSIVTLDLKIIQPCLETQIRIGGHRMTEDVLALLLQIMTVLPCPLPKNTRHGNLITLDRLLLGLLQHHDGVVDLSTIITPQVLVELIPDLTMFDGDVAMERLANGECYGASLVKWILAYTLSIAVQMFLDCDGKKAMAVPSLDYSSILLEKVLVALLDYYPDHAVIDKTRIVNHLKLYEDGAALAAVADAVFKGERNINTDVVVPPLPIEEVSLEATKEHVARVKFSLALLLENKLEHPPARKLTMEELRGPISQSRVFKRAAVAVALLVFCPLDNMIGADVKSTLETLAYKALKESDKLSITRSWSFQHGKDSFTAPTAAEYAATAFGIFGKQGLLSSPPKEVDLFNHVLEAIADSEVMKELVREAGERSKSNTRPDLSLTGADVLALLQLKPGDPIPAEYQVPPEELDTARQLTMEELRGPISQSRVFKRAAVAVALLVFCPLDNKLGANLKTALETIAYMALKESDKLSITRSWSFQQGKDSFTAPTAAEYAATAFGIFGKQGLLSSPPKEVVLFKEVLEAIADSEVMKELVREAGKRSTNNTRPGLSLTGADVLALLQLKPGDPIPAEFQVPPEELEHPPARQLTMEELRGPISQSPDFKRAAVAVALLVFCPLDNKLGADLKSSLETLAYKALKESDKLSITRSWSFQHGKDSFTAPTAAEYAATAFGIFGKQGLLSSPPKEVDLFKEVLEAIADSEVMKELVREAGKRSTNNTRPDLSLTGADVLALLQLKPGDPIPVEYCRP